jgi:hypothetical protein
VSRIRLEKKVYTQGTGQARRKPRVEEELGASEEEGLGEARRLGLVYFSGIFTPERCGDMRRFGVHPILSNPLKYSSPKNTLS